MVAADRGAAALAPLSGTFSLDAIPVLLGLLIVVQGFETSRYLGEEFDAPTRIRTMRLAQIVAAAIYVAFFALMLPVLPDTLDVAGETAIIDAAAAVGAILPLMLTIGAGRQPVQRGRRRRHRVVGPGLRDRRQAV